MSEASTDEAPTEAPPAPASEQLDTSAVAINKANVTYPEHHPHGFRGVSDGIAICRCGARLPL